MDEMIQLQKTVKDNAADVQDYLRDLENWSKQMETKDEQIRQAKKKGKTPSDMVRSREDSPPKKQKTDDKMEIKPSNIKPQKEDKKEKKASDAKLKSCDYASWDKFDVEAACEEIEKEVEDDEGSDEEEMELERKRVEAVAEKERGNAAFKAGNWDKAIEKYTRGLQLDPENCVLSANRAMALLKKGQFAAAEIDCSLALSIDPTYVKAFQRRASARTGLKRFGEAVTDYDEVLRLEPGNKAAQTERVKLLEIMREGQKKDVKAKPAFQDFKNNIKNALKSSDVETLKRDYEAMKEVTTKLKIAEDKLKSNEKKTPGVPPSGDDNRVFPIQKPTHLRSQKPLQRIEINDVESEVIVKETTKPAPAKVETKIEVLEPASKMDTMTKSKGLCKKVEKEISTNIANSEPEDTIPTIPKSSCKFLADWKKLKTVVNRSKYLRQFQESDYKHIFKNSLDGLVLAELVTVIHHLVQRGDSPDIVLRQMRGLSSLPRLTAVAMFMGKEDKTRLRAVMEELQCVTQSGETEEWAKRFML